MEIIGIITTLFQLYPFTLEQTLIFAGILKAGFDAVMNKQWKKLEEIVMEEALPLVVESTISNKEKRDAVVVKVYSKLPKWLVMFVSLKQVEQLVDYVYVTQVKPLVKREGLEDKGIKDIKTEENIFG